MRSNNLIEQFKGCIHADIKIHLDEREINNLKDAATTADDFTLTHKLSTNNTGGPNKFNQYHTGNSNRPNQSKSSDGQKSAKGTHSQVPHIREIKILLVPNQSQWMVFKHQLNVIFVKNPGHIMSKCYKLMAKQAATNQSSAPTGCAVSIRSEVRSQAVKQKDVESEKIREDFESFVLEGSVSLEGDEFDPKPIKIMRDTCCAQSMILERSLPFSEMSATGENVLIQGIGMDVISVPLYKITR